MATKEYLRQYLPEWRKKNPDYFKKYYEENKENFKAYYQKLKIKKLKAYLYDREYHKRNREKRNARSLEWYYRKKLENPAIKCGG